MMVRGSVSDEERESWNAVFKLGFVFVVAGSAALIALQGNATLPELALVAAIGGVVGWFLLRYLLWASRRSDTGTQRRRRFK